MKLEVVNFLLLPSYFDLSAPLATKPIEVRRI
jgi:hypothetical protein